MHDALSNLPLVAVALFAVSGVAFGFGLGLTCGCLSGLRPVALATVASLGTAAGGIFGGVTGHLLERHYKLIVDEERYRLKPIVVVHSDIAAGGRIDFDFISQRSIPQEHVTRDMITPAEATKVVGARAAVDLRDGDVLQWSHLCGGR